MRALGRLVIGYYLYLVSWLLVISNEILRRFAPQDDGAWGFAPLGLARDRRVQGAAGLDCIRTVGMWSRLLFAV